MNKQTPKEEVIVYLPVNPEIELPTEEGYYRTTGGAMSSYFHLDKGEKGQFEHEYQFEYWLKPVPISDIVKDKVKEALKDTFDKEDLRHVYENTDKNWQSFEEWFKEYTSPI